MIWNSQTRGETQRIIEQIPPLSWNSFAELFRTDDCHHGPTAPGKFAFIPDPDDRKFAALAAATGAILLTNDDHLLSNRDRARLEILTPREYCERRQG
jgi:predicted nucleic acid-binding protein